MVVVDGLSILGRDMTSDRSFFDQFENKQCKLCLADGKKTNIVGVREGHFTGFDKDGNVVVVK